MRILLAFIFAVFSFLSWTQAPVFHVNGNLKNHINGKPEAGVKVELVQVGSTILSVTSTSNGKYDIKGAIDYSKPFEIRFAKDGFVAKKIAFDYSKMNVEDAPPGEIQPYRDAAIDMIPNNPAVNLSFLNSEPIGKFYYDEFKFVGIPDVNYNNRMKSKVEKVLIDAEKNKALNDANYQALIKAADGYYLNKNLEAARAKYEEAIQIKGKEMEKHPNDRILELDALIAAKNKEDLVNAQSDSEYLGLIKEADALRDQKKYDLAIDKYEDAIAKRDEDYPNTQIELIYKLKKEAENEEKFKEAVRLADMFYAQKSWPAAKEKYLVAQQLKPSEPHPIARLADIDAKLNGQTAAAEKKKKYEEAVAAADVLFTDGKYEDAKLKYKEALTFENAATYPVERGKECDKKIAEALLEKQKQEKIVKLLAEGGTLFTTSKWLDAKAKYTEVKTLDPANSEALGRLDEIEAKLKEEQDVAAQMAKFTKLVAEGDLAIKTLKFADALGKFEEAFIIKQDPGVQVKIDDAKKRLQEQEDKAAQELNFNKLKAEGLKLATEQQWLEAKSKLIEANAIKVDPIITQKLKEIEEKIKAKESMVQLEKDYQDLITQAQSKETSKEYDGAIAKYKEASLKKPAEQMPREKIIELTELKKNNLLAAENEIKYNAALKRGDDFMAQQKYLEAIKEFNTANGLKPEEKEPVDKAAEAERLEKTKSSDQDQAFEKMLNAAQTKLDEKDFAKARELADRAAKVRVNDERPKELLNKITLAENLEKNYNAKIAEAEKLAAEKNYMKAIAAFEQAKIFKADATEPQERIDELNKIIADASLVAEKEALYKDFMNKGALSEKAKNWEQALLNYQNALNLKEKDQQAQNKIDEMQQILDDLANASKSELEKLNKFNALIKEADDLFANEDYLSAKAKYESALAIIGDNAYAISQVQECQKREIIRSEGEVEKNYQKIVAKGDENFNVKDYEKAKEYYNRALSIRNVDPYPKQKLAEIEAIVNPVVIVEQSITLEPLGEPFQENSIMDGYAALVQADIERKNIKDEKVERKVNRAIETEKAISDLKVQQQLDNTNEIENIIIKIGETNNESDLNREAIVRALREADSEYTSIAAEEALYKQSDLVKSQGRIEDVIKETGIDYNTRNDVYEDNTILLHSYEGSLRVANVERSEKYNSLNIDADQKLKTVKVNLDELALQNTENRTDNETKLNEVIIVIEDAETVRIENKEEALLGSNAIIEVENVKIADKAVQDSKHAPTNNEDLKVVSEVVLIAENYRSGVAKDRTTDNTGSLDAYTITLDDDYTDRENGRKENTEKLKDNESALVSSAEQTYSDETLKYLQNKNVIENEDAKVIGVREKEEAKSDENALAVESIVTKATDNYETNTLSDDEQRLNTRSEIEIVNVNSAEYYKITNEKQEKNASISDDLNKSISTGVTNLEYAKTDKLQQNQQKLDGVEDKKPERIRVANALGNKYPEGVTQESFTQNDENGLMKSIITRRIVVINGEGNVYVRTQTLQSITYSKNDQPTTENVWQKETTGPHLQKHY